MEKTVLIVGGGGREHALASSFAASTFVDTVLCIPGNAGTSSLKKCRNIPGSSLEDIVAIAQSESVDLVVPGPEIPLAAGLVDLLKEAGIPAFGPKAASAHLEASKGFAKDFMAKYGVATADYVRFSDYESAKKALDRFGFPVVVKADGLAAGKGVLICADRKEAEEAVDLVMKERAFGDAGAEIVLEECLIGWETSIIGLIDGETFLPFLPAKDHKRAGNGDKGLNTGGMGVIAPHPQVDEAVARDIEKNIIEPTMCGLKAEGLDYAGFLFIGVMVTESGAKTLEYNVRFGDPEAQALLPLLETDFHELIELALDRRLAEANPRWRGGASCCVVLASEGYPENYPKGKIITGISKAQALGAKVYLAGAEEKDGILLTSGGRVLGVTGIAEELEDAQRLAYEAAELIHFDGAWCRDDIGS